MNAITSTIPNHAALLIDAVSNRLHGCIEILMLLRDQTQSTDAFVYAVLEDALGDQIETLEEHLLPLVTGKMPEPASKPPPNRCVPRA